MTNIEFERKKICRSVFFAKRGRMYAKITNLDFSAYIQHTKVMIFVGT